MVSRRQHLGAVETAPNAWHQYTAWKGTDMPRVKKLLPVFGGLLYVVLSMLFGSVWYAVLSTIMTRIKP
jgi:hypothetical protein